MTLPTRSFLVEDAVDTLIDYLRGTLNTAIDFVRDDYSEGAAILPLDHVPESRYYITEQVEPFEAPAVFVLTPTGRFDNQAQTHMAARHMLVLGVLVEDVEEARLTRMTWRYLRAAYLALHPVGQTDLALKTLRGDGFVKYLVEDYDIGEILGRRRREGEGRSFRKEAYFRLTAIHHESF